MDILVATDILSRGIDVDGIRVVINYDVPRDPEDYVHRVGRTARANSEGLAITFVSETEQGDFRKIEQFIGREVYKIPVPDNLGQAPEYSTSKRSNGGRRGSGRPKGSHGKPRTQQGTPRKGRRG